MKLAIYQGFFESFIKLPKEIQKKATDFMEKFRNAPTSSSINYEKIKSFKDTQLRTVRIDLGYRAIIRAPEKGDLYHILWVDHHDKAMEWAKNKLFEWNKMTQSYQIYSSSEEQLEDSKHIVSEPSEPSVAQYSVDELLKIGVPENSLDKVKTINDLEDLYKLENFLPTDAYENLFFLLEGEDINTIIQEVEEGKATSDKKEEQENSANNLRMFYVLDEDTEIEKLLSEDFAAWKVYLHPSQRKLVESSFKGPVKVSGAAGTGKTVVALHRAKWLTDNFKITFEKPLLFTTFTKSLIKNLKENIKELKIDQSKLFVDNLHHFAVEKAKSLNLISPDSKIAEFTDFNLLELWDETTDIKLSKFSSDFLKVEYEEIVLRNNVRTQDEYLKVPRLGRKQKLGRLDRMEIWSLIEKYKELKESYRTYQLDEIINTLSNYYSEKEDKPFSHVICDELQDFSDTELRLLRNLVEKKENDLFLVGDPLQKIYDRRINFSSLGIEIKGKRSKRLKINYRTTEEIKLASISIIKDISFDNFDGDEESKAGYLSLLKGEKPSYEIFKNITEEYQSIKAIIEDQIEKEEIPLKQICIGAHSKDTLGSFKSFLHEDGLPYFDLRNSTGDKNGIHLSTFHSLKGLEFKIVFLVGISNHTFPFKPHDFANWDEIKQKDHIKRERSLLYVAMSRAIQCLYLTGTGDMCELINF